MRNGFRKERRLAFVEQVRKIDPNALVAAGVDLLQLNIGLRCNMACAHCHQQSSSARTESMPKDVFYAAWEFAKKVQPALIDLTGGAPELHPEIRQMVDALCDSGFAVQVRTNLTALLLSDCRDLAQKWAQQGVSILASLPSWQHRETDVQRGRPSHRRRWEER